MMRREGVHDQRRIIALEADNLRLMSENTELQRENARLREALQRVMNETCDDHYYTHCDCGVEAHHIAKEALGDHE